MKQLLLMRGVPGVGKSTFIKENGLENYTLSPDTLRLQFGSPIYNEEGRIAITQDKDNLVWKTLFEILENRMSNGEFTVIDATHSTGKLIKRYEKLAKVYGYRVYVVTLEEDLDTLIERNNQREKLKQVPVEVIENIYERLQHEHIPSVAKELKPEEVLSSLEWDKDFMEVNHYDKIHVIGDVHSCFTALNEFASYNYIVDHPNELFIFVGDYFDRGLEPKETFDYLEIIHNLDNVELLEGNHERHLRKYAYLDTDTYKEFHEVSDDKTKLFKLALDIFKARGFVYTLKSFLDNGITPKRVRAILRNLQQVLYFNYRGQYYVINHGGILPNMLDNLNKVSTHQLINGVGSYEFDVDSKWKDSSVIQIHGHRNLYRERLDLTKNSINLEGRVEKGGYLRAVTINSNNNIDPVLIKNEKFNHKFLVNEDYLKSIDKDLTVDKYLNLAKEEKKSIKVIEQYNYVVSVNFTKKAFDKKRWNQLTVSARGLFIDTLVNKILGRGYNKFFNINERPETKLDALPDIIKFPLYGYKKENGYLGLVYFDSNIDDLVFCSKSKTHLSKHNNDYALWFKDLFDKQFDDIQVETIVKYLKEHDRTLVFEVIDIENDPHIIEYDKSHIVLLDIIHNTLEFKKESYSNTYTFALSIGVPFKSWSLMFDTWVEFYDWYKNNHNSLDIKHEGYVFEDSNGFMFKYKSKYYNDWKYMRGIVESLAKGNDRRPIQRILQENESLRAFYYWVRDYPNLTRKELKNTDIITLRKMQEEFAKNETGRTHNEINQVWRDS